MKFTDPQGRTLTVNSPDGSIPTEQELDQMFSMKYGKVASPTPSLTERFSSSKNYGSTGDKVMDAMIFAQKEIVGPVARGANTAFLGIPRAITKGVAGEDFAKQAFPEQSSVGGKVARVGSEATGLITGGVGQIGTKVFQKLAPQGAKIGQRVLAGTASGMASGAALPTESFFDAGERAKNAAIGGAVGGALPVAGAVIRKGITGVKDILKGMGNVKDPIKFSKDVRSSLFEQKSEVGKTFGNELEKLSKANPNKGVDLSNEFYGLKGALQDTQNPGLASEIVTTVRRIKNPELAHKVQSLIDNPDLAKKLTLSESNQIKTAIKNAPSISAKLKQGKFAQYSDADRELLDLVDEIGLAQSNAFPEMEAIRKPYAEYMNNYRRVKNMFKEGALIGKMKKGFGDEEIEAMVKHVLPKATSQQIKNYRKAIKAINLGKWAGAGIATGAVGAGTIGAIKHGLK